MALGYALLHPYRIELSLRDDLRKPLYDEIFEIVFGTFGAGEDLGQGFDDYIQSRLRQFGEFIDGLRRWIEPGGPFGWLRTLVEGQASVPDIGAMLDRLANSMSSVPAFRESLRAQLYVLTEPLPAGTASVSVYVREQFNAITEILEAPLRAGRNDREAHRAFRAAVLLRQILGPLFEQTLSAAIDFDLRRRVRLVIDDILNRLNAPEIDRLLAIFASFRAQFGGLFSAFSQLNASFSVSISVEGPQGMPNGTDKSEHVDRMAAHPRGHWLWFMDLFSGIACTFCAIWEMVRSNNFKQREADGVLNIIGILWRAFQTFMRAVFPHVINLPADPKERNLGNRFRNWVFTDQADFAFNLTGRFFGSLHDAYDPSNWSLGFAGTLLKYYSNVLNTRVPYWTSRSLYYFYLRRKENADGQASLTAAIWAIWGPITFFSSIGGLIPAWENFSLETGLTPARTLVPLIVFVLAGLVLAYLMLGLLVNANPFDIEMANDWPTFSLLLTMWTLALIAGIVILVNLETDAIEVAVGIYVAVLVVIFLPVVAMPFVFGLENASGRSFFLHWFVCWCGVVVAGIFPFILWWYYIDDGRDKKGYLKGKDAPSSPYKLPYPAGENWLCSQAIHGIFSHYDEPLDGTESDNHYSYDFCQDEDEPCLAARDGVVITFTDNLPNGGEDPNRIDVQHVDWHRGHDPGYDLERVLTIGEYVHSSQNRVWVDIGHRLVQGYYLMDIDNTGRSALNHVHFNAAEVQRITSFINDNGNLQTNALDVTYAVVFSDDTLRRWRNFPLIVSWPEGAGHIDGKPLSMAYHESTNQQADPVLNPVRIQTSSAATATMPAHSHFLELDRRSLSPDTLPDSVTLFTHDDAPTAGVVPHVHSVVLDRNTLMALLGLQPAPAFTTSTTNEHAHDFGSYVRRGTRTPQPVFTIVNPPAGRLLATLPGPYRLVGEQLVVRVNDRAIEYFTFGAHRPALPGDVALDRGITASNDLLIETDNVTVAETTTARRCASLLNDGLRTSGPRVAVRCVPALVIETRLRGRAASLQVTFGSLDLSASGTGAFDDIAAITPDSLASHVDALLKNAWPAPPAGLAVTAVDEQVNISLAGGPVDLTESSSRIADVFGRLYDPATLTTRARGPMPLSTGRVVVGGGAAWEVPLLATHPEVRIDTGDAAFSNPNRATTPLVITVYGDNQNVWLADGDTTAEDIALRINVQAEGVRAFAAGNDVVVQTVAGGGTPTLSASKEPTGALGSPTAGVSAGLSTPLDDSCAVSAGNFAAAINDTIAWQSLPYDPVTVEPQARIDAGRLVIEVAAGHTVTASAEFTGAPAFTFAQDTAERVQTEPLTAPIVLSGPAWIDVGIDDLAPVRIPLDGECARVDIAPLASMPAASDTLSFSINGAAAETITFAGTETSVEEVALLLARASNDLLVRIAYVYSIENTLYQDAVHVLQLTDTATDPAPALAQAGFLRDRAGLVSAHIGFSDDALAVATTLPRKSSVNGAPLRLFSVTEVPGGSGSMAWRLDAAAGYAIRVTPTPVADAVDPGPLRFPWRTPSGFAPTVESDPVDTTVNMRAQCREYLFEVQDVNAALIGQSTIQLTGNAAMIRAALAPDFSAPFDDPVVPVRVTGPNFDRSFAVNLAGVVAEDDLAHRFNQTSPAIRAWMVRRALDTANRLHVETAGAGTSWTLTLGNVPVLLALGFTADDIDLAAGTLTVSGHGSVADSAAVTQAEITAALERAVDCCTGLLTLALAVFDDGTNLILQSFEGTVTVETEPAAMLDRLNVTQQAGRAIIAPGGDLDLDDGTIIVKIAGRTAAVAHVWGTPASLRANRDLASLTDTDRATMLDLLRSQSLTVTVDDVPNPVPPAASAATLEDVIEWIAGRAPEIWIGLVDGRVTLETRGAGAAHRLAVDFSAFAGGGTFPPETVLGFEASQVDPTTNLASAEGKGSVSRRRSLSVLPVAGSDSLRELLQAAAGEAASPQAVFDAELDTTVSPQLIRLRTHVPTWTLEQAVSATTGPASIAFATPGGAATVGPVLEAEYPAAQPVETGLFEFTADVDAGTQAVQALLAAQPARLPPLQLPSSLEVLNGTGFTLTAVEARQVVFAAGPATTALEIAAQIERQSQWSVRARVASNGIVLETLVGGSAKTLTLGAPSDSTPSAVTNDPATGFTIGSGLPVQAQGSGFVAAMDAVTGTDIQNVLSRGYIGDGGQTDTTQRDGVVLDPRGYDAVFRTDPMHARLRSRRNGCMSAVEPVVDLAPSLTLERSLERGPASRGSVALPPFTDQKTLSGTLFIQLNDNPNHIDVAAPVTVPVTFSAGDYTARQVARRIHEELFARGIGQAAAFPDGTVVIETRVPGLAGSVRIPAPGTATAGADQALFRALAGNVTELFGRGYPGAGFNNAGSDLLAGGRSYSGQAQADAVWTFVSGTNSTTEIRIQAGQTLTEIQQAVDSALATAPGGRMGLCMLGPDGTLYVEASRLLAQPMMMTVNGAPTAVTQPQNPGETSEWAPDPAIGFRFTTVPRTVRYARDRVGISRESDLGDAGWVRIPMHTNDTVAGGAAPGSTSAALSFPAGIYWTAIRNDAAKTLEYHSSGDMIISGGTLDEPGRPTRFFVHQARYWIGMDMGQMLRIVRTNIGEFLVEVLWPPVNP